LREIFELCTPPAERVAAEPNPTAHRAGVDDLADSVHALVVLAAGLLAEADARRAAAHLPVDKRGRAVRALLDLAEHPTAPELTDAMLASGAWVTALTDLAGPHSGRLSDLLAVAPKPGTMRGLLSVSERVINALHTADLAVAELEHRLGKAALYRKTLRRNTSDDRTRKTEQARAELAKMGVQL
jgi:hypothetical protein